MSNFKILLIFTFILLLNSCSKDVEEVKFIKETSQNEEIISAYSKGMSLMETGDYFAKNRNMNSVQVGSLIAIKSVGAYGSVLSSNYNSRPQIAEIIVQNDKYEVIRERVEVRDIIARERIANWL